MAFIAAPRLIDLAIFVTLGGLWIFGAVFIVTLYRWLARYERETQTADDPPTPNVESLPRSGDAAAPAEAAA